MITYGHATYIAQAIDGVLKQQCNYPFELIIANDASPDNTDAVIRAKLAAETDTSCIKYTCHQKNKGVSANFRWALSKAAGKYIAFCEGDDFWTDSLKLQKQITFLEAHEEYTLCYHNVWFLDKRKHLLKNHIRSNQTKTIHDLISGNIINTASAVIRKSALDFKTIDARSVVICDYALFLFAASKGSLYYLKEPMAVYRYHAASFCSGKPLCLQLKWAIKVLDSVQGAFAQEVNEALRETRNRLVKYLILENLTDATQFEELYSEYVATENGIVVNPEGYRAEVEVLQAQEAKTVSRSLKEEVAEIIAKIYNRVYLKTKGKWRS